MTEPIKWSTPAGSLGTFTELIPAATGIGIIPPPGTIQILYVLHNGSFPSADYGGVPFTLDTYTGSITGIPGRVSQNTTYEFTIRVFAAGLFSDRTFSMTITGTTAPSFVTPSGELYSPPLQDSTWTTFQIEIDNPDPNTTSVISLIDGSLPPGLEINADGLIRGYAEPPVTALNAPTITTYPFTLQVKTESGVDYRNFQITVKNQELNPGYTGREPAILNTRPPSYIVLPSDPNYGYYLPETGYMGLFSQQNNFVFEILGYDWADQPLEFNMVGTLPNGLETNFTYTANNITLNIPTLNGGSGYAIGDVLKILGSDIGGLSPNHDVTFTVADVDIITGEIKSINELSFMGTNCNSSGVYNVVPIYTVTGIGSGAIANVTKVGANWITGSFDLSNALVDTYNFSFYCTNPQTTLTSDTINFSMVLAASNNNVPLNIDVNWLTDSDLGTIYNGNVSTLQVKAASSSGLPLVYELVTVTITNTTSGTNILTCDSTSILQANQPIVFSGTVFGNIVAGDVYYVLNVINSTTFTVTLTPGGSEFALVTASGTMFLGQGLPPALSFNSSGEIIGRLAFQSTNDLVLIAPPVPYYITVRAYNIDYPEISSSKTFKLSTYNKLYQPYNNIYIKAMLKSSDKSKLLSLIQNPIIIPPESIYRPSDPYFGLSKEVIYQHMYGVLVKFTQDYIDAVTENYYWRYLTLGPIKTAEARDANNNVLYEVVYSEIVDDLVNKDGISVTKEFTWPSLINGYPRTVYPNSLINMRKQMSTATGQITDSSILPLWMTTQQQNGSILGFVPAWVICYTLPGHSTQIKENIETKWIYKLNELAFQIDRLEINNSATFDYEPSSDPAVLGTWNTFPSGVVDDDRYDSYIYYPQKNILY